MFIIELSTFVSNQGFSPLLHSFGYWYPVSTDIKPNVKIRAAN